MLLGVGFAIWSFAVPRNVLASALVHTAAKPGVKTNSMGVRAPLDTITAAQIVSVYSEHGLTAYPETQTDWVSQLNHGNYGWDHFLDNMARSYGASAQDVTRVYAEHGEVAGPATIAYWTNQTQLGATGQYGWDNFRNEIARVKCATAVDVARIFASHNVTDAVGQADWLQQLTNGYDWNAFLGAMRSTYGPSAQDILNAYGYHRQIAVDATQAYWLGQLSAAYTWDQFLDALVALYGASNEDVRRIYAAHGQSAAGATQEDWVRRLAEGYGWAHFQTEISNVYGGTPAEITHLYQIHNIPISPNTIADLTYSFTHGIMTWVGFQNSLASYWGATNEDIVRIYASLGQIAYPVTQQDWVNKINVLHTFTFEGFIEAVTVYYASPPPVVTAVTVTPAAAGVTWPFGEEHTQPFTITNTGAAPAVFIYTLACSANVGCTASSASGTTAVLQPGGSQGLTVTYQAPSSDVSGTITVTARHTTVSATVASGTLTVVGLPGAPLTVRTMAVNSGAAIERSGCVTIGVGEHAAYECGDLRLSHALPATTTLGRTRAPMLTYVSRHASPIVLLAADVAVFPGGTPLTGLTATVTVTPLASMQSTPVPIVRHYPWTASWADGQQRRIVVPVNAADAVLATGTYRYTLEVKGEIASGTAPAASDTGRFTVIDRRNSPFGSGWSLDGLEELVGIEPNRLTWIGGDGNARLYERKGNTNDFVTQQLDRPDTLRQLTSGNYQRVLPNGAYVELDGSGRHVQTRDALGYLTRFAYDDGTRRLASITLPVPDGGVERAYRFYYNTASVPRLAWVQAPSVSGNDRITYISVNATGAVDSIRYLVATHPDTRKIAFGYQSGATVPSGVTRHLTWRRNALDFTTSFHYDTAGTLDTTRINMEGTGADIVNAICAAETVSLTSCAGGPTLLPAVVTRWDGPRTDAADITTFYVNRFGAPDTIVNALGQKTRLERSPVWPMLAAATIAPNGLRTDVIYNGSARDSIVTVSNPLGDGVPAVTRYEWHSKWDQLTSIVGPSGERQAMAYAGDWPELAWRQDGSGDSTKTYFTYQNHQLASVQAPGSPSVDHLEYDAALGNLKQVTSATGAVTRLHTDAVGRVDSTYTPIDATHTRIEAVTYDLHDRVLEQRQFGPALPAGVAGGEATGAQTLVTTNGYDKTGNLKETKREAVPASPVGTLTRSWTYDAANRRRTATDERNHSESWTYDPAGNTTAWRSRRSPTTDAVTSTYDGLNRLATRTTAAVSVSSVVPPTQLFFNAYEVPKFPHFSGTFMYDWREHGSDTPPAYQIPADVARFTYDMTGGIDTAVNGAARIVRQYFPNGALRRELQQLATVEPTGGDPYAPHQYELRYTYDLSGRRLTRRDSVPGCQWWCQQDYNYATETNHIESMLDQGALFGFSYDRRGRLTERRVNASGQQFVREVMGYDDNDRQQWRDVYSTTHLVFDDQFTRDSAGRVVHVATESSRGFTEQTSQGYTGLGALAGLRRDALGNTGTDLYTTDAFGNVLKRLRRVPNADEVTDTSYFEQERLTGTAESATGGTGLAPAATTTINATTRVFDDAGSQIYGATTVQRYISGGWQAVPDGGEFRWSGYGADDKLRVQQRSFLDNGHLRTVFTEFRYDALGRRVQTRTRNDQFCTPDGSSGKCLPSLDRTVWDGDQVLVELRSVSAAQVPTLPACVYTSDGQLVSTEPCLPTPPVRWVQNGLEAEVTAGPWGGSIRYTHGGGIDEPLAVWHSALQGLGLVPHRSWRGVVKDATYLGAAPQVAVAWPGTNQDAYRSSDVRTAAPIEPTHWIGSILDGTANETGLVYQRNRYYDPKTGRFTQEDPIGLAGGMNLYGFAGGDPVNFSDPFGLCGQSAGSDTTSVELCQAKADLPGNVFDIQHMWFRIGGEEFGLGTAGGGVPGEGPYVYQNNMPFLTPAEVTNHAGRSSRAGASCQVLSNVSSSCVRDKMELGAFRGAFQPIPNGNNCQTVARTVITQCSMPLKVKPDATRVVLH